MRILNLPCTGHNHLLILRLLLSVASLEALAFAAWEHQLLLSNSGLCLRLCNLGVLPGWARVLALDWVSSNWVFVSCHRVVIIVIEYALALGSTWLRVVRRGSILSIEVASFVVNLCLPLVVSLKPHGMGAHLINFIWQQVVMGVVCAWGGLGRWTWVTVRSILITSRLPNLLTLILLFSVAVLYSRTLLLHLNWLFAWSWKTDSCFEFRLGCLDLGRWLIVLDFSPLV